MDGFTEFVMSPIAMGMLVGINTTTNMLMMLMEKNDSWMVQQTITVTAPDYAEWTPNGEQLFINSTSNNEVQIYNMNANAFTLSQTLALTDAGSCSVTPNSLTALVCQPTQNQITIYDNSSNTWASGSVLAITSPTCVLALSDSSAVVTVASGYTYLNYSNGAWSVGASGSLSYTPNTIVQDNMGGLYAIGNSSTTGYLTAIFNGVVVGGASWSGSADSVLWSQGQILVADSAMQMVRVFALVNGQFTQMNTAMPPMGGGALTIGHSTLDDIFVANPTATNQYAFAQPYTLDNAQSSTASLYISGGWNNTVLPCGEGVPTACTFDDAGYLWVATLSNNLYKINSGGIVSTQAIPQNGVQPNVVPIGISALMWDNSHLYATSCLEGGLIEVI
jgi:hypothetical protein